MNKRREQAVALITGSAKRVGKAMAEDLHRQGFDVLIHYRHSKEAALHVADKLNQARPDSATALYCDLDDISSIKDFMSLALSFKNRLDLLINNASLFLKDCEDETLWRRLMACHVEAPYYLSEEAYPWLKQSKGCIINVTDCYAERPLKDYGIYCMSKAALAMQTKVLAQKFAPEVRVNAIAPGAMLWPEGENSMSDAQKEACLSQRLLKILGGTRPMVQAVNYLVDNKFVTGTSLAVDGGLQAESR